MAKITTKELNQQEIQDSIEKDSIMPLNMQEYIASLHLAIKELDKQVKLLQDRCDYLEDALENP